MGLDRDNSFLTLRPNSIVLRAEFPFNLSLGLQTGEKAINAARNQRAAFIAFSDNGSFRIGRVFNTLALKSNDHPVELDFRKKRG